MAHDYAKKSRTTAGKTAAKRSPRKKAAPKSGVPGWVWLFVGTVVGAFVMFLVRLADIDPQLPKFGNSDQSVVEAPAQKPSKPANKTISEETPVEPQKPRFDFYKMLKENEVPVPEVTEEQAVTQTKKPRTFILQVASFKQDADAESLKVELILLGLEPRTETVTLRNGEIWHRVLVGPFDNRSMLSKARNRLISNGHQALVLEFKGENKT